MISSRWSAVAICIGVGCATILAPIEGLVLPVAAPGRAVTVVRRDSWVGGRGAVIRPDLVVTVRHVLPDPEAQPCVSTLGSKGFVDAAVVGVVHATPEEILLLRIETSSSALEQLLGFSGFASDECYRLGDGSPAVIVTNRGHLDFLRGELAPGDSGSPVLDRDGDLVGLLCGRLRGVPAVALLDPTALDNALRREVDLSSLRRRSSEVTLAGLTRLRSPFGGLEHALNRGLR